MWWMAIPIIAGAVAGGISTYQQGKREKDALEHQKKMAWKQYQYGKDHSDRQFGIQKDNALYELGVQRKNLDTNVGLSIDEFNTSLLAQAFGIQDARIQTGSAVGASLAQEGASGVKGSATGDKIRAYATQSLERNIEVQDKQNANYLNRMMTGANMTLDAIGREEASWMPGGHRMLSKQAQDNYNRQIADLGQTDFDWRINKVDPNPFINPDMWFDYFTSSLGGASSGMSLGNSIDRYKNAWGSVGK